MAYTDLKNQCGQIIDTDPHNFLLHVLGWHTQSINVGLAQARLN